MVSSKMKVTKTTVYTMDALDIVGKLMDEKKFNFSRAVCFLILNGDYLIKKVMMEKEKHETKSKIPVEG